jgi:hypothetical protein
MATPRKRIQIKAHRRPGSDHLVGHTDMPRHAPGAHERSKKVSQGAGQMLHDIDQAIAGQEEAAGAATTDQAPLSPGEIAAAEQGKDGSLYRGDAGYSETKRKFWTRKKIIAGSAGGGGIIALVFGGFVFIGPFKVPAIVGSFEHDLPSSRMMRLIVEKPVKRMTVKYLVAKKAGNLSQVARPGSVLDKMFKMFDAVDAEKLMRERVGIEVVSRGGQIRIVHKGKEVGTVRSDAASIRSGSTVRDWERHERRDRKFGRASRLMSAKGLSVGRIHTSSSFARVVKSMTGHRFVPLVHDPAKSAAQNVQDEIVEPAIKETTEEALETIDGIMLALENQDTSGLERSNQPVDTTTPDVVGLPDVASNPESPAGEVQEDAKAAVEDMKQRQTRLYESLQRTLLKNTVRIIDVVGWVSLLADLMYLADQVNDKNLFMATIVMLREFQAASIAAHWLGHSDGIKDQKMNPLFVAHLSGQLNNSTNAAMTKAMYGETGGVPVDTKIGSGGKDMQKDFYCVVFDMCDKDGRSQIQKISTCEEFVVINSVPCILHGFLSFWRKTLGKIFGAIEGAIAQIILYTLPQYWAFRLAMDHFGNQAELVNIIVTKVLKMFGFFGYDPTAKDETLVNSIGVGVDVLNNRYMETNLGAREVTDDPNSAVVYMEAEAAYRESLAALPLYERLFAGDVPDSLVNKLALAAPASVDPGTVVASVFAPIKSLPATFMSLFTGRSSAATAAQQVYAVNGVGQFGGNAAEVDADVPGVIMDEPVENIQDLECPPNREGFFNNCQRYKQVIQATMCYDVKNPCPEWR